MRLAIAVVALALCASAAWAGGINLAWNDCYGVGGGAVHRSFACDTNVGSNDLYVSVDPPVDLSPVGTFASDDVPLSNPLANNFVTWQGGGIGGAGCPGATPTLNRTWGQLKSVYR